MPVYHSKQNSSNAEAICGAALLPLRTKYNGPAHAPPVGEEYEDIIDEALKSFRWNIFFKGFQVLGSADLVLVYLTVWIQKCLFVAQLASSPQEAKKQLEALATSDLPAPGKQDFVLGSYFTAPNGAKETETIKNYLKQLRQETVA
eukprot:CAMPEP_0169139802 /NCGR_PEP_ID=MMETSP1015-20121227/43219_1 /TAXON_ID=342587 /ORGANISM="Karlodinium micrum, Strain CCMP2283" /LENGTH=145 /DNA_ID=CAMNT_0009205643 /DNA_START=1 /DNA_END=435 /DNA_ORIENTATION=+